MTNQSLQNYQYNRFLPDTPSIGGTTVKAPGHVHLSFGYPSTSLFPIAELSEAASEAILNHGDLALHYSGGEGPEKIKDWIRERSKIRSIFIENNQIIAAAGAIQAIDSAARVLINAGDEVWVESPSFFNALRSFRLAGAKIRAFPIDEHGVRVDLIEKALEEAKLQNGPIPKFFYCMPNFHNPAGVNLSVDRRKKLAELAYQYNFYILEDDAYADLSFDHQYLPAIYSFGPKRVIYLGTFSKIIGPGIRLGWAVGEPFVLEKMRLLLLGSQTSPFTQEIIAHLLEKISFDAHLERLISVYRKKRDVMMEEVQKNFGDHVTYNVPKGGFFLWLIFRPEVETSGFVGQAFENGVSVVDGHSFFDTDEGTHQIRLCFTYCSEEQIRRGVKILADAYFAYLKESAFQTH